MTLTELRYITAVAKEKHFGKAAARCGVSQPTLSIAVKKLEEELDVVLFDRSSSEVIITPIGKKIVAQAEKVLNAAGQIQEIVHNERDELTWPLKLGLIFTVAPYLLPKLVTSLHEAAPQMPLLLEENYTDVLMESLKKGDLDVLVAAEPINDNALEVVPLYEEPFFVIVPKGHPFEDRDQVTEKQLIKEKMIFLTEGNCMRDNIFQSCRELAAQQKIQGLANTLQGSSINTIRYMVASGLAISILPATSLTEHDHMLFSIVPFKPPVPSRKVVLVSRRNGARPRAVQALRDAVFESKLAGVKFIHE